LSSGDNAERHASAWYAKVASRNKTDLFAIARSKRERETEREREREEGGGGREMETTGEEKKPSTKEKGGAE
jgi:hypothetical protein